MRAIDRIRGDFEREFGEPGYSTTEISNATFQGDMTIYPDAIKRYVSEHDGLAVDLTQGKGVDLTGSKVRILIPESKLAALMGGVGIEGTVEGLIERMEFQRKKPGNARNRNISKRVSRSH